MPFPRHQIFAPASPPCKQLMRFRKLCRRWTLIAKQGHHSPLLRNRQSCASVRAKTWSEAVRLIWKAPTSANHSSTVVGMSLQTSGSKFPDCGRIRVTETMQMICVSSSGRHCSAALRVGQKKWIVRENGTKCCVARCIRQGHVALPAACDLAACGVLVRQPSSPFLHGPLHTSADKAQGW